MHFWEKAEELGVDPVRNDLEVLRTILELDLVNIDDQKVTVIFLDPVLVTLVKAGQVVDPDAALLVPAPFLDLGDEIGNRGTEINQKVRLADKRHHQIEEVGIILEIPGAHKPHRVEVGSENPSVLIDRPVLDDHVVATGDVNHVLEPLVQEIYLEIE